MYIHVHSHIKYIHTYTLIHTCCACVFLCVCAASCASCAQEPSLGTRNLFQALSCDFLTTQMSHVVALRLRSIYQEHTTQREPAMTTDFDLALSVQVSWKLTLLWVWQWCQPDRDLQNNGRRPRRQVGYPSKSLELYRDSVEQFTSVHALAPGKLNFHVGGIHHHWPSRI